MKNIINNAKRFPLIVAEIGQAHEGSVGLAHSFIDAIADCGADAVKFQCHFHKFCIIVTGIWEIGLISRFVLFGSCIFFERGRFHDVKWYRFRFFIK